MCFGEQTIKAKFTFAIAGRTGAILKKDAHTGNTCFDGTFGVISACGGLNAIIVAICKNLTHDIRAIREDAANNVNSCGRDI